MCTQPRRLTPVSSLLQEPQISGKIPIFKTEKMEAYIKMDLRVSLWGWEVARTGSGSCAMVDFRIESVSSLRFYYQYVTYSFYFLRLHIGEPGG